MSIMVGAQTPLSTDAVVAHNGTSTFRGLLESLQLTGVESILDVGAGGFLGKTTTVHLLDLYGGAVTAVELDGVRAHKLAVAFGDKITVHTGDVAAFAGGPFDLVVIDLDMSRIPMVHRELVPGSLARLARPGGLLVTNTFNDVVGLLIDQPEVANDTLIALRDFVIDEYGTLVANEEHLQRRFANDPLFEFLGFAPKFPDREHSVVGWVALRRTDAPAADTTSREAVTDSRTSEPVSRRDRWFGEVRALCSAGDIVSFDLAGARDQCGGDCDKLIATWREWARRSFSESRPAGELTDAPEEIATFVAEHGDAHVANAPVALLEIPPGLDGYLQLIGAKSRNMLRKSERTGLTYDTFQWNDRLDDMFAVNTSKEIRSGGPMDARYSTRLKPMAQAHWCSRHKIVMVGGFRNDALMSYCQLIMVNELAVINRILGHEAALADGVMNGLVAALVRLCQTDGTVKAINYLDLISPAEGLVRFKRSVGFASRAFVFTAGAMVPEVDA
jgi:hypothetical protein